MELSKSLLGGPPLVGPPLGPGFSVFFYISGHLTWIYNIFLPSWWNGMKFLETFPGCLYTSSKYFLIICMSVCLLFSLLPYWHIQIQGYLKFWSRYLTDFFGDIPGMLVHLLQMILISRMSVSLLVGSLPYWN